MHYIPTVVIKEETRWEYRLVEQNSAEPLPLDQLNTIGRDGWELSAILPHKQRLLYYFKRTM